jgi:Fic family protein
MGTEEVDLKELPASVQVLPAMRFSDLSLFKLWQEACSVDVDTAWKIFAERNDLPAVSFSNDASAVASAAIEGNTIDLNFYLNSRHIRELREQRPRDFAEIECLVAAYEFAERSVLTEPALLEAHRIAMRASLTGSHCGVYRTQLMFVHSALGITYAAVEPQFVEPKMSELFAEVAVVLEKRNDTPPHEAFQKAAFLHLLIAKIHPFQDGNGRMARLAEKWLLASILGEPAWKLPSESYYLRHRSAYYEGLQRLGPNYYDTDYRLAGEFLALLPNALTESGAMT